MNCEMAQQAIALAQGEIELPAKGEEPQLSPAATPADIDAAHLQSLANHIAACETCRDEWSFHRELASALSDLPLPEPSPSLVASARARLDSALDTRPAPALLERILLNISFGAGRLRAAPMLTSALIVLGLCTGAYVGYQAGRRAHLAEQTVLLPQSEAVDTAPTRIAAVTGIVRGTDPRSVEVHYDRLVPDFLPGSLDDPNIRALLLMGAHNADDASVRSDAVALLALACRDGHQCATPAPDPGAAPVLSVLLSSLRSDREPQVRLVALHGLEPFVARDLRVRNAVLETLMSDPDLAVRNEALRLLPPVQVDSSVRQVLHTVATRDGDASLRTASQQILDSGPQLQ